MNTQLVEQNMRFVYYMAGIYARIYGLPVDEMTHFASLGALQAARTYNAQGGRNFTSWASLYIRQQIHRAAHAHFRKANVTVSLDAEITDGDRTMLDTMRSTEDTPADLCLRAERIAQVRAALARLPEKQRKVLAMRHGLEGQRATGGEAIARALGCSRQNVHVHAHHALTALRKIMRDAG